MLDPALLRRNPRRVEEAARRKGFPFDAAGWASVDEELRTVRRRRAEKRSDGAPGEEGGDHASLRGAEQRLREKLRELSLLAPNLPNPDREEPWEFLSTRVSDPRSDPVLRPHTEMAASLGLVEHGKGRGIAGRGAAALTGPGASMERALEDTALRVLAADFGFREFSAPPLVGEEHLVSTGHFPYWKDRVWRISGENLVPAPRMEAAVLGAFGGRLLEGRDLPLRLAGRFSASRREGGGYGRRARGLLRQRQFRLVEIFWAGDPAEEDEAFRCGADAISAVLGGLGLGLRARERATARLSFAGRRTADFEAWLPASGLWCTVGSLTAYGQFQARRAELRFRPPRGKSRPCATVTGTVLSIPRVLAAILETGQTGDGRLVLPDVLAEEMGMRVLPGPGTEGDTKGGARERINV
jgi:seryl-tRNA synthetase